MAARGVIAALVAGAMLALAGAATAAATPQQVTQKIFADLADNGRLDGHYTRKQINRALRAPSLQSYERPARKPVVVVPTPAPAAKQSGSVPFSGLDLALFGGVGVPLLLLGASLGRFGRLRPHGEPG